MPLPQDGEHFEQQIFQLSFRSLHAHAWVDRLSFERSHPSTLYRGLTLSNNRNQCIHKPGERVFFEREYIRISYRRLAPTPQHLVDTLFDLCVAAPHLRYTFPEARAISGVISASSLDVFDIFLLPSVPISSENFLFLFFISTTPSISDILTYILFLL
jgi:hypothetical protein